MLSGEQSVGEVVPLFNCHGILKISPARNGVYRGICHSLFEFSRKSTALDLAEIVIFRFYEFQNVHSYSSRSNTKSQHLPSCIRVLVLVILILEFMPL